MAILSTYLEFLMHQDDNVVKKTQVSAGVIIKHENNLDHLLLIRRSKTDTWSMNWEFPRGHVKEKETLEEGLIREVKEETGLDVEPIKFIGKFKYIAEEGTRETTQYNYLCKMKDPNQKVKLSFEHDMYRWIISVSQAEMMCAQEMMKIISRVFNNDERIVTYPERNEEIDE
jgi:mutator protein MutT